MILQIEIDTSSVEGSYLGGMLEGFLQTTKPLSPTNQKALEMLEAGGFNTDGQIADAVEKVAKMLIASEDAHKLNNATAEWLHDALSRNGEAYPPRVIILTRLDGKYNQMVFMGGEDQDEAMFQIHVMLKEALEKASELGTNIQYDPPAPIYHGKGGTA